MSERGSRTRRKTSKAVDYAADPFSDEDLMEEDEVAATKNKRSRSPVPGGTTRRGRPRKSNGGRSAATQNFNSVEEDDLGYDDMGNAAPVYTEKGYDHELTIRERFTFAPEYEADGSPKIDCIMGRRIKEEKRMIGNDLSDGEATAEEEASPRKKTRAAKEAAAADSSGIVEYEYLIKYKGVSYLHLEWKLGTELESMNKSAKTILRRFLKKIELGADENLEDPTFDPSLIDPQKIVDEEEQEVEVEMTDKEIVQWEKEEKQRRLANGEDSDEDEDEDDEVDVKSASPEKPQKVKEPEVVPDEKTDPSGYKLYQIRKIVMAEPYYPVVEGSDNPYRDGYVKHAPKKPRPSYLLYQHSNRMSFQARYPNASVGEIMSMLGDAWKNMTEEDQQPYITLAAEESHEYERHKTLCEKGQRPTDVWQPMRRCLQVLERLSQDSYANIFLEPVDTESFPDYLDVVDTPMDLSKVRDKLVNNKYPYQAPEMFARDMRKIWNNCKVFNQHGSAIWHVADYMSKQFERLYQAWVINFKDKHLRWVEPKARPWELSCRATDGACKSNDDNMIVCDHCDAMYGMKCLKPPLKHVPRGIWRCPDCKKRKGERMLSAVSEQAARKRAELGDIPKKRVKQRKYLVKWSGLGYEQCSWETAKDINDDNLIAEYRKLNHMVPDEPLLPYNEIQRTLLLQKHQYSNDQDSDRLYALTRAFQFAKFGKEVPEKLFLDCGPECNNIVAGVKVENKSAVVVPPLKKEEPDIKEESSSNNQNSNKYKQEVAKLLSEIEFAIGPPGTKSAALSSYVQLLPEPLVGEYDTIVPITSKGLMMNVGEMNGSVSFLGYRKFPDGTAGPAEQKGLIASVGDKIIAVNGKRTTGLGFKQVIELLREAGKYIFCHMRFLRGRYSIVDSEWTSCGDKGSYITDVLNKEFRIERREVLAMRAKNILTGSEVIADEDNDSVVEEDSDDDTSGSEEDSDDEFENDSGDEEVVKHAVQQPMEAPTPVKEDEVARAPENAVDTVEANKDGEENKVEEINEEIGDVEKQSFSLRETTRSLALRLLDVDVGYSSDEAGDEDGAYLYDGVDDQFRCLDECVSEVIRQKNTSPKKGGKELMRKERIVNFSELIDDNFFEDFYKAKSELPVKRNEFNNLGPRSKLCASICLTSEVPQDEDFADYGEKPANPEVKEESTTDIDVKPEVSKPKSTTKVEQIDPTTENVLHVWVSAKAASLTLQLPLDQLLSLINGEYNENVGDEVGGFRWKYADDDAIVTAGLSETAGSSQKSKLAYLAFKDKLYDPNKPHIYKNGNVLRDYQVDGVNWLASCWYKRHNAILADEMGLGKTVQIVTYLEHIFRVEKIKRPFLVVVPLSTVEHWRREFTSWTNMVTCIYHDRQRVWRDVSREYEWYYKDRPHTAEYLKFDVLVTTYDTLIADIDVVSTIPFRVAVVDEAHRLRNQKGKLLECMKLISQQGTLKYGFQSRILMTGTPLQNNTQELWTLLNFIEPFNFPSLEEFEMNFGDMKNQTQVSNLQKKISPFMLRRVKEDVAKDIPSKEETLIDVELTSIQKQYYRAIFEHNHAFLSMGVGRAAAPKLMNIQMELRKCCNHPFLLEGVEQREMGQFQEQLMESNTDGFNQKSEHEKHAMLNKHGFVMSSGKMVLLDKLLPKLRSEGHKVLIFSQMVRMLDLISDFCDFRGFRYERLDGRVRGNERQKSIDRFNNEDDSFIFLLSTRAGGVGINLTAADTCIIFDSDWNPQNDVQAQARCHRIGQTRDVRIYRLITSRTFEQEMFDRASRKLGLEQAVLGTFDKDNDDGKPTLKEMEHLLKRGAYALMEGDDDEIGREFCEDDIEDILAKRTRTRVVEGAKTASWLNKQGFTKTKFTGESAAATSDVNVDDPMFWQKIMPDFVTPQIMLTKMSEIEAEIADLGKSDDVKTNGEAVKNESKANEEEQAPVVKRGRGRGRGRGRKPKVATKPLKKLTGPLLDKRNKFIADLTSMMDDIFSKIEEESLPQTEKDACQKLLLKLSLKVNVFTEEQRDLATSLLSRIEGDRRRRCRTEDNAIKRRYGSSSNDDTGTAKVIPEELLIFSKQKKRTKRTRKSLSLEKEEKEKIEKEVGDDGYLHHSDSDNDDAWADMNIIDEDDPYSRKKGLSREDAKKRSSENKVWANDSDPLAAAARAWPALPRNKVRGVLETALKEVMKLDEEIGSIFSEPVSKLEFPEYFEVVNDPMDYGTMMKKLEKGDYKTARSMQKDFMLVMTNCSTFNAPNSDIVREAQKHALAMPRILRDAAFHNNLFLAEDGSVLDIFDEPLSDNFEDDGKKKNQNISKNRRLRCGKCVGCRQKDCGECSSCREKPKYGGGGTKAQSCLKRKCMNLKTPEEKYGKKRKQKVIDEAIKNGDVGKDVEHFAEETKPKKRGPKPKKEKLEASARKRRRKEDVSQDAETDLNNKSKSDLRKGNIEEKKLDVATTFKTLLPHVNIEALDEEYKGVVPGSFEASLDFFTGRGAWEVPEEIKSKWIDVARMVLQKVVKEDRYDLFAEPVTEEQAPGYAKIIEKPMDLSTMRNKLESGKYNKDGVAGLYEDLMLIMNNCIKFNGKGDEITDEAARVMALLPGIFAASCAAVG